MDGHIRNISRIPYRLGYGPENWGSIPSRGNDGIVYLFAIASRLALGSTQSLIPWVPSVLTPWVKRPGREADHLPPHSAEVKNTYSYTSTPPTRLHGMILS